MRAWLRFSETLVDELALQGNGEGLDHGVVLLHDALRNELSEGVLRRRKAGFGAQIRSWLRHDLASLLRDALSVGCQG